MDPPAPPALTPLADDDVATLTEIDELDVLAAAVASLELVAAPDDELAATPDEDEVSPVSEAH